MEYWRWRWRWRCRERLTWGVLEVEVEGMLNVWSVGGGGGGNA